jgi:hypothetical protein
MAKRAYRGAQWPTQDYQVDVFDLRPAFDAHAALQGSLRDEFARAAQAIRDDVNLSSVGKARDLKALAARYAEHPTVKQMRGQLDAMAKREKALREKLTSRPAAVDRDSLSPF